MIPRSTLSLLLGLGALGAIAPAAGGGPPAAALAKLDAELAAVVNGAARPLASLSVLAIRDGNVVYARQFGSRFIDNADPAKSRPANADTMYRIASISKFVTALGVMRMIEAGQLDLDRDAGEYLGYALRNPNFPDAKITLRMLLSHTSSLRDDGGYVWPARIALKDVLVPGGAAFAPAAWAKNAGPGTYFQYTNFNYGVIGTVMERAGGERFDRLMKRLVLDPLGLRGGFNAADFPARDLDNVATLYRKASAGDEQVWNPPGPWVPQVDDYSKSAPEPRAGPDYKVGTNGVAFGPHGNLRLSAAGLGTIARMLLAGGMHEGKRLLKAATIDAMFAPQWSADGQGANGDASYGIQREAFNAWGLGPQLFRDRTGPGRGDRLVEGGGFEGVGHSGDAYGLAGQFVLDRKAKNGMILLSGGTGFDPATTPGTYSSHHRYEELILTGLFRRAVLGDAN